MTAGRFVSSISRAALRSSTALLLAVGLLSVPAVTAWAQPISNTMRVASVETEVAQVRSETTQPDTEKPAADRADAPPASPMVSSTPIRAANPRALYRALIEREVRNTTLPADVAEAVMGVESGYDPTRIGADGEIGLMQVMPPTARMLGYTGPMTDFAAPEINIKYGVIYLAQAWAKAGGELCTALMKYRAGHGETRFSQLSVDYCIKARARLMAKGYPLTGSVPVATFGFRPGGGSSALAMAGCRKGCLTIGGSGRVDFNALNNRLAQVAIQVNTPRTPRK
jgi:soluble lytic murein transglycosylase-like protein